MTTYDPATYREFFKRDFTYLAGFLRPPDLPEHAGSAGRACTNDDVAVVKNSTHERRAST